MFSDWQKSRKTYVTPNVLVAALNSLNTTSNTGDNTQYTSFSLDENSRAVTTTTNNITFY